MEKRNMMLLMLLVMSLGYVGSDLEKDRAECSDQLVGLSTCLPYVGGQAKVPTKDCCQGFKQVLDKSKKCICILVKDRNDPKLGLKINATLAVNLPTLCHQSAPNISQCVPLLNLSPNSAEAKDFESLGKIEGNSTASPSQGRSAAEEKNDGGRKRNWVVADTPICAVLSTVTAQIIHLL